MKKFVAVLALMFAMFLPVRAQVIQGLPPGIILQSDGHLVGTPTTPGVYQFKVVVCDSEDPIPQCSIPYTLGITVYSSLVFGKTSLPFGVVGEPYDYPLQVHGGESPYDFRID